MRQRKLRLNRARVGPTAPARIVHAIAGKAGFAEGIDDDGPVASGLALHKMNVRCSSREVGMTRSLRCAGVLCAWGLAAVVLRTGASTAAEKDKPDADARKSHWSFQPIRRPEVPKTAAAGWARNPIDDFIAARLGREELEPSAEADRTTLIRRLKFDLIGLPPTPDEVTAFVRDERPDAYEQLVDRYLASPQFGERWARHWLDVVRFAETTGFETNAVRANAWPYRDYVIRAFNENKPYDLFIRDQLAGDAGGDPVATGYLVAGAYDQVKGDPALSAQQRADDLHYMISTTGGAFLGLTIGCARCHDHKFDPISQADYYGMKAIFAGVQHGEREVRPGAALEGKKQADAVAAELSDIETRLLKLEPRAEVADDKGSAKTPGRSPVSPRRNLERFAPVEARFVRMTIMETTGNAEPCIDELEVFSAGDKPVNIALATDRKSTPS